MAVRGGAGKSNRENFETHVSLTGIETYRRGQKLIGAGWKALRGDVGALDREMKGLHLTTGQYMTAGAGLMSVGIGMGAALKNAGAGAMQYKRTLGAIRTMTRGNNREMQAYLDTIRKNDTPIFSDADMAGAIRAGKIAQLSEQQIMKLLPGLKDASAIFGESLDTAMTAVGRAASFGEPELAERIGLQLREFAVLEDSQRMYGKRLSQLDAEQKRNVIIAATLRQLEQYQGGVNQVMRDGTGAVQEWNAAVANLSKDFGGPAFRAGAAVLSDVSKAVRWIDKHMTDGQKTAAGYAAVVGAAGTTILGGILLVMPGIKALRDMWLEVAGAAELATVAQKGAAGAGGLAGAASLPAGRQLGRTGKYVKSLRQVSATAQGIGTGEAIGVGAGSAAAGAGLSRAGRIGRAAGSAWGKVKGAANLKNLGGAAGRGWAKLGGLRNIKGFGAGVRGWGSAMRGAWGTGEGVLGALGITSGGIGGGLTAALGPAGIITEGLDWLLGTITGQGDKRIGNGGWLPNLSLGRATTAQMGIAGDAGRAVGSSISARRGAAFAEEYVRSGNHSIRKQHETLYGPAKAGITPSDPALAETNELLRQILGEQKKRGVTFGSGKGSGNRKASDSEIQRAIMSSIDAEIR